MHAKTHIAPSRRPNKATMPEVKKIFNKMVLNDLDHTGKSGTCVFGKSFTSNMVDVMLV